MLPSPAAISVHKPFYVIDESSSPSPVPSPPFPSSGLKCVCQLCINHTCETSSDGACWNSVMLIEGKEETVKSCLSPSEMKGQVFCYSSRNVSKRSCCFTDFCNNETLHLHPGTIETAPLSPLKTWFCVSIHSLFHCRGKRALPQKDSGRNGGPKCSFILFCSYFKYSTAASAGFTTHSDPG